MTGPDPSLDEERDLLATARRATLTTLDVADGRPRSVPICFEVLDGALWSPLDEKPKAASDPRRLRRVRNLIADPRATILVDRWDEDWTQLGFVELACRGKLVGPGEPGHAAAVAALRAKYPQYRAHDLGARPMLRFEVLGRVSWRAARTDDSRSDPPPPPAPGGGGPTLRSRRRLR